jgi:hypothetical protein
VLHIVGKCGREKKSPAIMLPDFVCFGWDEEFHQRV